MMSIFKHKNYKIFIKENIQKLPYKGRGETSKIAQYIKVTPSFIGQVLNGDKHFSMEQILGISRYFNLIHHERDCLIYLLQKDRAGDQYTKQYFEDKINILREESTQVKKRIASHQILSEYTQARFYSEWTYSAVKLLCTKEKMTLSEIEKTLQLSKEKTISIVEFLLETKLIEKDGHTFKTGVINTHLPTQSPLISAHHKNWRLKAMEKHPQIKQNELAFSAPFGISKEDFPFIKEKLLGAISSVSEKVNHSKTEELACLNIDLFYLT